MKKGDKVICDYEFPPIPGASNFTPPKEGETYTVKTVLSVFNGDLKKYILSITLVELPNKNIAFDDSAVIISTHPNEDFPYNADFFKLKQ